MTQPETGTPHHVELWVPHLERAAAEWGWLLGRLGYVQFQDAGGPGHYAAYLANTDGFEAELVG